MFKGSLRYVVPERRSSFGKAVQAVVMFFNSLERWRRFLLAFIAFSIPFYIIASRIFRGPVNIQLDYHLTDSLLYRQSQRSIYTGAAS
jgi:hypothetical protein